MSGGEDEAISIGPFGIVRVVPEVSGPEDVSHRRSAHGESGMTGVGFLDHVDRESANGVD